MSKKELLLNEIQQTPEATAGRGARLPPLSEGQARSSNGWTLAIASESALIEGLAAARGGRRVATPLAG